LTWLREELALMGDKINIAVEAESNTEQKEIFKQAENRIANM